MNESFRDRISTVDERGRRVWLYPKAPRGRYTRRRQILAVFQLLILVGLPFVKIGGHPAILLNVLERKFVFFGHIFWPQDLYLFALSLLTFVVFILLFTAAFGRIFCGWLCPQTVFLEMVFRPIERWIEGSVRRQKQLDQGPWTWEKVWKKGLKHGIFYGISFFIGNIFLAYIIGIDRLWEIITDPPQKHLVGLGLMILFSGVFYFVFSRFREQACILVCPYGRLQSVLQDKETIAVYYDFKRGEPRGKRRRKVEQNLGDCVDCKECVAVCPTGIDIRNGLQMECVNCTACMDACDYVMEKLGRPKGLIRYSSYNMIEEGRGFRFSPRVFAYGVVFLVLFSINFYLLYNSSSIHVILTKVRGSLYVSLPSGEYANAYQFQILNKTFSGHRYRVRLLDPLRGRVKISPSELFVPPEGFLKGTLVVVLPREALQGRSTPIQLGFFEGDQLLKRVSTNFIGPWR